MGAVLNLKGVLLEAKGSSSGELPDLDANEIVLMINDLKKDVSLGNYERASKKVEEVARGIKTLIDEET